MIPQSYCYKLRRREEDSRVFTLEMSEIMAIYGRAMKSYAPVYSDDDTGRILLDYEAASKKQQEEARRMEQE